MQKGQILIWIIVGTLILLVVGGAYYLGRSTSPKPSATPTVISPIPQPTLSPSNSDASPAPNGAGETTNWKVYTDQKNIFLIKYPNSWSLFFRVMEKKPSESLKVWLATIDKEIIQSVIWQRQIILNGSESILRENSYHPTGRVMEVYILKDDFTIIRIAGFPVGKNDPSNPFTQEVLEEFNQILSTFRFL